MIAKKQCGFFFVVCIGYVVTFANAQQIHNLKLCTKLNETVDRILNTPLTQHDFSMTSENDQHCVIIDPCTEKNHRGQVVPRGSWMSRKMPEAQFDDELQLGQMPAHSALANLLHTSYNFYNIEYAQVPEGIILQSCQPDMSNPSATNNECGENEKTTKSVDGKCPSLPSSAPFTLFDCVASTEFDNHQRTVLHLNNGIELAYWRTVCYEESTFTNLGKNLCAHMNDNLYLHQHTYINTAAEAGSTQNFMYEFENEYGCFDAPGVGFYLSSVDKPNRIVQCPLRNNAYSIPSDISTECKYACDVGYFMQNDLCLPNCGNLTLLECPENNRVKETCLSMAEPRYSCEQCDHLDGHSTVALSSRSDVLACEYSPCSAGKYSNTLDGGCHDCPIDTYSGDAATSCTSCNTTFSKTYQPNTGRSSCVDCFSVAIDSGCSDGEQLFQNFDHIVDYFETISKLSPHYLQFKNMSKYCHQNHACLPCYPGFYEVNGKCIECPYGTYQPNFKSMSCFDCSHGQNTSSVASASEDSCLCQAGFE